ncbi:MAG: oxidative damage protection protein [Gammaproteobacteria bacterium]|nr:oxidative damage protection protein [Gammaproteobacteria bacterium]
MVREVKCIKYKIKLPGLETPPMPGEKGDFIFNNVSQKAWQAWLNHQTMLINEKRLVLSNMDDRQYLREQMDKYMKNKDFDIPAGYVEEEKTDDR